MVDVSSKTILIVDDSSFQRKAIKKFFVQEGYNTVEAGSGLEGLDAVAASSPDFIVTDLLMPGMDGFQFVEALRAKQVTTPVVVLSADVQDSARQRCMELGAQEFMNKPLKKDQMREILQRVFSAE